MRDSARFLPLPGLPWEGGVVALFDAPRERAVRDGLALKLIKETTGQAASWRYRPSGRPMALTREGHSAGGVSFSHAGGTCLLGWHPIMRIGVDLEADDPSLDWGRLSRDHFSPDEAQTFERIGSAELFLRFWTVKEAVLKISGRGIADGVHRPDLAGFVDPLLAGEAFRLDVPSGEGIVAVSRALYWNDTRFFAAAAVVEEGA